MPACSVYGCTNNSGIHRSVGYYAFPDKNRNPSQYVKWLSCTRLKDDSVMTRNTRVCGKHFIESDFCESDLLKRRIMKDEKFRSPRLKQNAVPSKFLGKGDNPFSDNVPKKQFNPNWELLFMCQDFETHIKCLICYESLKVKKYNIQKHYQNKHGHDFDKLEGAERSEALKRLRFQCAAYPVTNSDVKFVKRRNLNSWREEDMLLALKALSSKEMGYKLACETYKVPHATLQSRYNLVKHGVPLERASSREIHSGNTVAKIEILKERKEARERAFKRAQGWKASSSSEDETDPDTIADHSDDSEDESTIQDESSRKESVAPDNTSVPGTSSSTNLSPSTVKTETEDVKTPQLRLSSVTGKRAKPIIKWAYLEDLNNREPKTEPLSSDITSVPGTSSSMNLASSTVKTETAPQLRLSPENSKRGKPIIKWAYAEDLERAEVSSLDSMSVPETSSSMNLRPLPVKTETYDSETPQHRLPIVNMEPVKPSINCSYPEVNSAEPSSPDISVPGTSSSMNLPSSTVKTETAPQLRLSSENGKHGKPIIKWAYAEDLERAEVPSLDITSVPETSSPMNLGPLTVKTETEDSQTPQLRLSSEKRKRGKPIIKWAYAEDLERAELSSLDITSVPETSSSLNLEPLTVKTETETPQQTLSTGKRKHVKRIIKRAHPEQEKRAEASINIGPLTLEMETEDTGTPEKGLSSPGRSSSTVRSNCVSESGVLPQQYNRTEERPLVSDGATSSEIGNRQRKLDEELLGTNHIDVALKKLEDISSSINEFNNNNNFDNFGKYVTSLLKFCPFEKGMELQQQIINLILRSVKKDKIPSSLSSLLSTLRPEAAEIPQSTFVPEEGEMSQSSLAPQTEEMHESRLSPETEEMQESRFAPETEKMQESRLSPGTEEMQESRFAAETEKMQESRLSPGTEKMQESRLSPETEEIQQSRFAAETEEIQQSRLATSQESPLSIQNISDDQLLHILQGNKRGKKRHLADSEVSPDLRNNESSPDDAFIDAKAIEDAVKRLKDFSKEAREWNGWDENISHFGGYVASLMRFFPTLEGLELQQEIVNLIWSFCVNPIPQSSEDIQ